MQERKKQRKKEYRENVICKNQYWKKEDIKVKKKEDKQKDELDDNP